MERGQNESSNIHEGGQSGSGRSGDGKIRGDNMGGIYADNGVPSLWEFLQRAYDSGFAYHMSRLSRSALDAVSLTGQRKDLRTSPYAVYGKRQKSRGK